MKRLKYIILSCIIALFLIAPVSAADRKVSVKTLLSSSTVTASTAQTSSFLVSEYNEGIIYVDVTAEASTSTLDIIIQSSPDDSEWYTHTTIGQITATGNTLQGITNFGKYVRISYIVGGTSFTFSIKGVFKN